MNTVKKFFFLCAFAVVGPRLSAQTTCHAADSKDDNLRRSIQLMMTPQSEPLRAAVSIPLVDSSRITLVSDSLTCARAGQVLDSLATVWATASHRPHPSTGPLYVFKVGNSYAVIYLDVRNENNPISFFNSAWAYTGSAS